MISDPARIPNLLCPLSIITLSRVNFKSKPRSMKREFSNKQAGVRTGV